MLSGKYCDASIVVGSNLESVVSGVGDDQVARLVDGDAGRICELPGVPA